MKRSFNNSLLEAHRVYLNDIEPEDGSIDDSITGNKTVHMIEGLAGAIKGGLKKVATARQKVGQFARNQEHGGTMQAMNHSGMLDAAPEVEEEEDPNSLFAKGTGQRSSQPRTLTIQDTRETPAEMEVIWRKHYNTLEMQQWAARTGNSEQDYVDDMHLQNNHR